MSFADQQAFYQAVLEAYPDQAHFNSGTITDAFDLIQGQALQVVEIGGWDGQLAEYLLPRGDIASWVNHDLVEPPQACKHPAYHFNLLQDYLWNLGFVEADVFVACHTIEHLAWAELEHLLAVLRVKWLYLESPLPIHHRRSWNGYAGSHILELTWLELEQELEQRGYTWAGTPNLWSHP